MIYGISYGNSIVENTARKTAQIKASKLFERKLLIDKLAQTIEKLERVLFTQRTPEQEFEIKRLTEKLVAL